MTEEINFDALLGDADEQSDAPELTIEEQTIAAAKFRDAIVKTATDNDLNFNIVFGALTQVAVAFIFDYNLVVDGKLDDDNVDAGVLRFNDQVAEFATHALNDLREHAKKLYEVEAEIPQD